MNTPQQPSAAASPLSILDRHDQRRAQGVPTLSVLLGSLDACTAAWRAWAESSSRAVLRLSSIDLNNLAQTYAAWAFLNPGLFGHAIRYLAARLDTSSADLARRIEQGTGHDRSVLLARARFNHGEPLDRFYRVLLRPEGPPVTANGWLAALAPPEHPCVLITQIAAALRPQTPLPALLCVPPSEAPPVLREATRILVELVQILPQAPVAIAFQPFTYQAYMAGAPESRYKAMLRETPVVIDAAQAAALPPDRNVAALRTAQAAPPLVAAYERLSRACADGTLTDDRARSEAERFFHAVLEGIPRTAGLFTLNGLVDIPFGRRSSMEVDLLCPSLKLAIELDGYHHFQDPARYRSDRAKDYLLQKHGYLVLRFLSEDVVPDLETILHRLFDALDSRGARVT